VITATLFPGRYIQGAGAIQNLGKEISRLGKSAFLLCSPTVYRELLPEIKKSIEEECRVVTEKFGGECSEEEITRVTGIAGKKKCAVVVGLGGGKTLDTAKAVAQYLQVPVVIVPTIASTDAPTSALSMLHKPTGEIDHPLWLEHNPNVVLLDSEIISQAPARFLVAGMGDAISKWFETDSCRRKQVTTPSGYKGSIIAYSLGAMCYQTLIKYGPKARKDCEAHKVTTALEQVIQANTLLSGLSFESGGLAAAHSFDGGFLQLEETHHSLHGEMVGFGTLISLFLTNKDKDIIDEVYTFCEEVGLPTTLADIGLHKVTSADLKKVATKVCEKRSIIHNESVPISTKAVIESIKAADKEGRRRKAA
jgi:glycerol dehydrogenase